MRIVLKRIAENKDGTFGVLVYNQIPFAVSLEPKWNFNKENESCINYGTYICHRVDSPKFGETFQVGDVEGRTHILFHKGNTEDDTTGCILIGEQFERLGDRAAILKSGKGFSELMDITKNVSKFKLEIEEHSEVY